MPKGYQPGNKYGKGRPVGSRNKKTEEWEKFVEFCVTSGLDKLQKELMKLEGKAFVDAFTTLLEFHKPKLSRAEVVGDAEAPLEQRITFVIKSGDDIVKQIDIHNNEPDIQDANIIDEQDDVMRIRDRKENN